MGALSQSLTMHTYAIKCQNISFFLLITLANAFARCLSPELGEAVKMLMFIHLVTHHFVAMGLGAT